MSLAETLVTIFVLTLIVSTVVGVYLIYHDVFLIQLARNDIKSSNSVGLEKISRSIREATFVVNSKTINSTAYVTDFDTLILELPSFDSDNDIIDNTFDYIVYFIDPTDNSLLKSDLEPDVASSRTGGTKLVTDNLDTLIFNYNHTDYISSSKIETIIKNTKTAGKRLQTIIAQLTSSLRN